MQPLLPLGFGRRIKGDATAGAGGDRCSLHQRRADRHIEGGTAARAHHADGAAVDATLAVLQFADQAHGLHLGRAGDRAAGKQCSKHIDQRSAGPRVGVYVADHLPDGGQRLHAAQAVHGDGKRLGDARQVVADQVDNHHVLGALLGRGLQAFGQCHVLLRAASARGRAFHGAGDQMAVMPVKKQFGRHRQHLLLAGVDVSRKAVGLGLAHGGEQFLGRHLQLPPALGGEVGLVDLAIANRLVQALQGGVKGRARDAALPGHAHGVRGGGWRRRCRHRFMVCLQRRIVHAKPHQRPCSRVHRQRAVKGGRCFVAHIADTPLALQGALLHRLQHGLHITQCVGHQHPNWRAKCQAQHGRARGQGAGLCCAVSGEGGGRNGGEIDQSAHGDGWGRGLPIMLRSMKLLILGGTVFLGRHVVDAALAAGCEVTLLNRGTRDVRFARPVEQLRGDRDGDLSALHGRRFDAVVDCSGYTPAQLQRTADILRDQADHYVFVSTISVYVRFAPGCVFEESAPVTPSFEGYGGGKARAEEVIQAAYPGRVTVLRPGLIVGPHDPTGRFTYWPLRLARGGRVCSMPWAPRAPWPRCCRPATRPRAGPHSWCGVTPPPCCMPTRRRGPACHCGYPRRTRTLAACCWPPTSGPCRPG